MVQQRILTTTLFTDLGALGEGRTYFVAGAGQKIGIDIEVGTSTAPGPGAVLTHLDGPDGSASERVPTDTGRFVRFRVTNGNLGAGQVWVTGPNDPGSPGTPPVPVPILLTTLEGPITLPPRPIAAGTTPAFFQVNFSGVLTNNVTLTLPINEGYLPGDVVVVQQIPETLNFNVDVVDGGTGSPVLGTIPSGFTQGGFLAAQLNGAGSHWERFLGWIGGQ